MYPQAIEVYMEVIMLETCRQGHHVRISRSHCLKALEFSPENPELLTTMGLLHLRMGENYKVPRKVDP